MYLGVLAVCVVGGVSCFFLTRTLILFVGLVFCSLLTFFLWLRHEYEGLSTKSTVSFKNLLVGSLWCTLMGVLGIIGTLTFLSALVHAGILVKGWHLLAIVSVVGGYAMVQAGQRWRTISTLARAF
jgi:hypothetical protein